MYCGIITLASHAVHGVEDDVTWVLTSDARPDSLAGWLRKLARDSIKESSLAGEPITAKLTRGTGNDASIGGLKVITARGWFAARPSGTENIYKIYAESFQGEEHLNSIVTEAQEIVDRALGYAA